MAGSKFAPRPEWGTGRDATANSAVLRCGKAEGSTAGSTAYTTKPATLGIVRGSCALSAVVVLLALVAVACWRTCSPTAVLAADAAVPVGEAVEPRRRVENASAPRRGAVSLPPAPPEAIPVASVLRGRIIDERTEEGVPALTVVLWVGGGEQVELRTNGRGWWSTRHAFEHGTMHLVVRDAVGSEPPIPIASTERSHNPSAQPEPWIVAVPIGPTIPLLHPHDASSAPGSSARIVERDPRIADGPFLIVTPTGFEVQGGLRDDLAWRRIAVRDGDPHHPWGDVPWIRYPRVLREMSEGRIPFVEVDFADLGHTCDAPIPSTVGIQPRTKVRPSAGTCALDLVLAPDPTVDASTAEAVGLLVRNDGGGTTPRFWNAAAPLDGTLRFHSLEPGEYRAIVLAPGHAIATADATLDEPGISIRTVALTTTHEVGRIEIGTTSDAGALVWAARPEAAPFTWASVGHRPGRAWVDGLALGIWTLRVWGREHALVNLPPERAALPLIDARASRAPDRPVRFVAADDPNARVHVSMGPHRGFLAEYSNAQEDPVALPFDEPFMFLAHRVGFEPILGTGAKYRATDDGVITLDFVPGWGAELFFRAIDDPRTTAAPRDERIHAAELAVLAAPPIPGVGVGDGTRTVVRADASGRAAVVGPKRLSEVWLDSPGWRPVAIAREPDWWTWRAVVWMEPD